MLKNEYGRYVNQPELYKLLGLDPGGHIPKDMTWERVVSGVTYRCLPSNGKKHRIQFLCTCGSWIPFGRAGQHRKACTRVARELNLPVRTHGFDEFDLGQEGENFK